jgi:hypothetical protein
LRYDVNLTKIIDSWPLCHSGFNPVERATDSYFTRSVLCGAEEGILDKERDVTRKRLLKVANQLFDMTTSGDKIANC